MNYADVREVLASYSGKDIPLEYARREAIAREKFNEQWEAEHPRSKRKPSSSGSTGGGFLSALGLGAPKIPGALEGEESLSEGFEKGKTFMDQVRERGQRQYELLEKEIRENGEKWLKEMAEEEKKMQEEAMKGMQSKVFGGFGGGGGK